MYTEITIHRQCLLTKQNKQRHKLDRDCHNELLTARKVVHFAWNEH